MEVDDNFFNSSFQNELLQADFSNSFWKFSNAYNEIHGWLSVVVCVFGILSNITNMIILKRTNMVSLEILDLFLGQFE